MRSHTVYRTFNTDRRREFIRITEDVADTVREAGIEEGMALVCASEFDGGRPKRLVIKVLGE